ncbi:hypothetical protein [Pseudotenacibaculum haliotis]|uniref:Uncharacterized protein n=1 Tax=Pseudotenacibaculum haliotis TaxID=1862138 RepID=A0ABW5LV93_9FLAO
MSNIFELTDKFDKKDLSYNFQSKFKSSPFGQYWEKDLHPWAIEEFGSSKIIGHKNSIYVADNSFKISNDQILSIKRILSSQKKPAYSFRVYADPDGEKVLKMYNDPKNKPSKKFEVLVFIETDDGKFDFGKIVRVKFGQEVVSDLRYNFFSEYPWNDKDSEDIANDFIKNAWETSQGISLENQIESEIKTYDFRNLLIKAINHEYDNKKFDDLSWLALLMRANGGYVANKLYTWSTEAATWLRSKKVEDEKYWNGALESNKYSPLFLPDIIFEPNKKKRKKYFVNLLSTPFNEARKFINDRTKGNNPISLLIKYQSHSLIDSFEKPIDYYAEVLSNIYFEGSSAEILKILNAFLVGLWNGIMSLIAGIFEIIGIIILILKNEFGYRISQPLKEKLENLFNLIFYESEGLYIIAYEKVLQYIDDLENYFDFDNEETKYRLAKDIGEIIPEILEYIIPVLRGKKLATSSGKIAKQGKAAIEQTEDIISKNAKEALEKIDIEDFKKETSEKLNEKLDELDQEVSKLKTSDRTRLTVKNTESIGSLGKNGAPVKLRLVDRSGKILGEITRNLKNITAFYSLKLKGSKRPAKLQVTLFDSKNTYNLPINDNESIIYADLLLFPKVTNEFSGIGKIILDDSLAFFRNHPKFEKVDSIYGVWVKNSDYYSEYGGQSINLTKFWEAMAKNNNDVTKSAFETFTGKWAKDNGFTKVWYDPINYPLTEKEVIVKFLKE